MFKLLLLIYEIIIHYIDYVFIFIFTSANMRLVEINEDVCLLDSATTHSILRGKEYFTNLTLCKANVLTISRPVKIIKRSGHATIMLPNRKTHSVCAY